MIACRILLLAAAVVALPLTVAATEFDYSWGHPRPQGNPVFGIAFADAQEGWAVGGSGFFLHTVDGGEHWVLQHGPLAVAPDLYDIIVTPSGTLIACGKGATLYRSTDGGATWSTPPHPAASDLRDVCLVPGGGISAAGAGGIVLVSTDDGLTWTEVGPGSGTIRQHVWRTATEGYAVGQGVAHRTTDGGNSWSEFVTGGFFGFNDVFFADALNGMVLEDFGFWSTADGGESWTEHFLPVNPLYRFRTVVIDPQHWLLACAGEGSELWETTDAGANWTQRQVDGSVGFISITQTPGGRVIYAADNGSIFWTDDFGLTANNATENLGGDAVTTPIQKLYTRPDGVLFAANQPSSGEQPAWLRSDDGGVTWEVPPQTPGLY